jgi:Xaa-Pro dipeptidase
MRRLGLATLLAWLAFAATPSRGARADEPLGAAAAATARPRFDLDEIQALMAVQRLDGWLLYDLGGSNPIAHEVVAPSGIVTRRWFYLVPAKGAPIALVPKMEAIAFANVPGRKIEYASWRELDAGLRQLLKNRRRVAMEYSPHAELPWFSKVDAGTVELVRSLGVEVISSADLVQTAKTRWGKAGRDAHYLAAHHLNAIKDDAFAWIAAEVRAGRKPSEYDVQQHMWKAFATRGVSADHPPIVAVNEHAANPHFDPTAANARPIGAGDLVLIDLWGKVADDPQAIYADITWVGYVGDTVPARYTEVWKVVVAAREAAVALVRERVKNHKLVRGFEADRAARDVIEKAGYGDRFIHRTGHSIDTNDHGDGANLDDYETHDTRALVAGAGFSVEPGIYLPGDFGLRSEIDCYIGHDGLEVTTLAQKEIVPILTK